MGMKMQKALLILPFLVAGLRHAEGNPEPLVSSSGMISMKPKKEASSSTPEGDSGSKPPSLFRSFQASVVPVMPKQETSKDTPGPQKKAESQPNLENPSTTEPTVVAPSPQVSKEKVQEDGSEVKRRVDAIEAAIISESLKDVEPENHSGEKSGNTSLGGKRQRQAEDEEEGFVVESDTTKPEDPYAGDGDGSSSAVDSSVGDPTRPGVDETGGDTSVSGGDGEAEKIANAASHSLNVGFDEESNYTSGGEDSGSGGTGGSGGSGGGGGGDSGPIHDPNLSFDDQEDIGDNATHEITYDNLHDDPIPPSKYPTFKVGPPWEDTQVVGQVEEAHMEPIEVSFKLAQRLCQAMRQAYKGTSKPLHYYLWAPINQYVPLLHKAFPMRPPVFSPECLKWVLRPCRGESRRPLLKPCTYWAPMRIRRPECGFVPQQEYKMVNYRDPMFVPGNCPCVWPCTRRFDHIQRCRVKLTKREQKPDRIDIEGDPGIDTELKIQENYAYQLCRSMRLAMSSNTLISIGWLPIRVENLKPNHEITSGRDYYGISKRETNLKNQKSKVIPKEKTLSVRRKQKPTKGQRQRHRHEGNKKHVVMNDHKLNRNILRRPKRDDMDNGIEDQDNGDHGVLFISFDPETHDDDPDGSGNGSGGGGDGGGGGSGNNAGYVGEQCPVWHYKACLKFHLAAEDVISAEGDHEKPDTSIETNSPEAGVEVEEETVEHELIPDTRRRKRKVRVKREEEDSDPSGTLSFSFDEDKTYKEGEGSFEIEDPDGTGGSTGGGGGGEVGSGETSSSSNSSSGAGSAEDPEICNEWYVLEDTKCVPETPVITKGMTGRSELEGKTVVRDICPGGGNFPCFLRRRKRDSSNHTLSFHGHRHGFRKPLTHNNHSKSGPLRKHEQEAAHKRTIRRTDYSGSGEEVNRQSISVEDSTTFSSSSSSFEYDNEHDSFESNFLRQKKSDKDSSTIFLNKIRIRIDSSCKCDWPCLPFYDSINKCYDDDGHVIVNSKGKPVVLHRSYRKYQRDPVVCINFADSDEVVCKIKKNRLRMYQAV